MKIMHVILLLAALLITTSCNTDSSTNKGVRSKGGLRVNHTPLSITEVPKELIEKMNFPYARFYRTVVFNGTDRPIKIIWFDGYFNRGGAWFAGNVRNRVLRSTDFMDWYSCNDMDKDGWLRPGGKATCFVNWHWTDTPEDIPCKWAYIGVDGYGNDYFAEAVVPAIKPEKLK